MALEKFFPPISLGGMGGFVRLFQEAGRPGGSDVRLKLFYSVHKTKRGLTEQAACGHFAPQFCL